VTKSADRISGAERSRWLAELAETIDQAQRLARTLGVPEGNCSGAKALYRRLELVRIEVEDLRRGGWATQRTEIDPKWMNLFPWNDRQTY
jgi:hypothetical protein